jgi:hypothetical protein
MRNIDIDEFKKLQDSGNVAFVKPISWEVFDLPEDLLNVWKEFQKAKDSYIEMLKKYGVM